MTPKELDDAIERIERSLSPKEAIEAIERIERLIDAAKRNEDMAVLITDVQDALNGIDVGTYYVS